MKVALRVDSSVRIGLGHLMRCLALADLLATHGHSCQFVCRQLPGHKSDWVKEHGHQLSMLENSRAADVAADPSQWLACSASEDAQATATAVAAQGGAAVLIVDHYAIDEQWQQHYLTQTASLLLVIDDLANRPHLASLLLDQTLGRNPEDYRPLLPPNTQILTGPSYALLRPEFAAWRPTSLKRRSDKVSAPLKLLIAPGGSDADGIGLRVLAAVKHLALATHELAVTLAISDNTPHLQAYRQAAAAGQCQLELNTTEMAALLSNHDLAIGAGGSSCWERCALGLPTLMITTAANQRLVVSQLAQAGAAIALGEAATITVSQLAAAIQTLSTQPDKLQQLSRISQQLCDGLGCQRLWTSLRTLIQQQLNIVAMSCNDCQQLFHWQQLAEIRRYSRNPQAPSWEEHRHWFANALNDPRRQLWLIRVAEIAVGMVRLDQLDMETDDSPETCAEVSILIDPAWQGVGLAANAIRQALAICPQPIIVAEVSPDNLPSQRLFRQLGFVQTAAKRFTLRRRMQSQAIPHQELRP